MRGNKYFDVELIMNEMKKVIDLNVAFETEFTDSGIYVIRLTLSKAVIRKLKTATNLCKRHNLLCTDLLIYPKAEYLLGDGSENKDFRIGSELFRVFRYGVVVISENKYDPAQLIESEEICIDDDLNITLPRHEDIDFDAAEVEE